MFKINRSNTWPPEVELTTARATIKLLERDMRHVTEFADIATSLADALNAIDKIEAKSPRRLSERVVTTSRFMADRRY